MGIAADQLRASLDELARREPAFAAALVRLLADRGLRERIRENAVKLARDRYYWRAVAPALLAVYRDVAG